MLLIIEALLILAALGQDHRDAAVKEQIFPLDMALNSVDDKYDGCTTDMTELVETRYFNKEINNFKTNFKRAWENGEKYSKNPENNLTRKHSIAIYVYTDAQVYSDFNIATRYSKQNYTSETYERYSLHFLLTEAIQILKKTQNACYDTYRRTKISYKFQNFSKMVRFGSFASYSLNRNSTIFGNVSCFEIRTCEGAEVTNYSKLSREREVLIPPYEMFNVTDVRTKSDEKDLWCDTVYTLKSIGTRSDLNCALFRRPTKTTDKYHVLPWV